MQLVVFEDAGYRDLLPLTYARPTFELRCGCDTLRDKIVSVMGCAPARVVSRPELAVIDPSDLTSKGSQQSEYWINGRLLLRRPLELPCPSACWIGGALAAAHLPWEYCRLSAKELLDTECTQGALAGVPSVTIPEESAVLIRYPWDLIAHNAAELARQVPTRPARQESQVYPGAHLLNPVAIRIGGGSRIKPTAVLDAEEGPIHIGQNVTVSPGAVIRGPCSIGDGTLVQPGASIREGTSIGPVCKVGGEIEGTIFQGYSNKQHDGFVGHSYIGEWVNLGADTVTSDLKNTYGNVSVPLHGTPIDTGRRFVGSIIGDHSKTGICTALTTGTVIGFCSNVVVPRPPQFVPSFTWLTERGAAPFDLDKAVSIAKTVMARRKIEMTPAYERLFRQLFGTAPRLN